MVQSNVHALHPQSEERCPECGASVMGGQDGCQALFHQIGFQASNNLRFAAVHRLAVDAYCMQHPEPYCHSAKSYAAHLTGLCCGIEHNGHPVVYAAIQKWLNGKVEIEKPEVLSHRGKMTLADVLAMHDSDEQLRRIDDWANSVWEAYATQHDLARTWIKLALARKVGR